MLDLNMWIFYFIFKNGNQNHQMFLILYAHMFFTFHFICLLSWQPRPPNVSNFTMPTCVFVPCYMSFVGFWGSLTNGCVLVQAITDLAASSQISLDEMLCLYLKFSNQIYICIYTHTQHIYI